MGKKILVLMVIVLGSCFQPVSAQPILTLGDLCRMADNTSEIILNAGVDLELARQETLGALSGLIPDAQVYGRYANDKNDDAYSPDANTMGLKFSQAYTLNGKEFIAWDMSRKMIEKAGFSRDAVRSDHLFNVAQSYIQVLKSLKRVDIAEADAERLKVHRDFVREQLKAGAVTKTALFRAKAELSKALTEKVLAKNDVALNKAEMVRLTGVGRGFSITDKGISDLDSFSSSVSLEAILDRAMANRYEIKQLQKALEIAVRNIRYENGAYWPALTLEGGYKETDVAYDIGSYRHSHDTENAYIQADLVFTLYDGGGRGARRQKAVLEVKKTRQDLLSQKKKVAYESEAAFLALASAREALGNLTDELTSARENFSAVQMQFAHGMTNSIEIMDANTLLVQAQRKMADARYTLYLAVLKIMYAQGDLIAYLLSFE
ncbi:MAG: TolC family protein [Proteobacteria bacterium]|nr:TolC family protein [Pseudomonadota bacterium]